MQVAVVGTITTVITTAGVIMAAAINGRKDHSKSLESVMQQTLRERITLRDEQIADLKYDVDRRDALIRQLQDEIRLLKASMPEKPD